MRTLQPGDIVRSASSRVSYTVVANFGQQVTAVKIADVTNPSEWSVISKVKERIEVPIFEQP